MYLIAEQQRDEVHHFPDFDRYSIASASRFFRLIAAEGVYIYHIHQFSAARPISRRISTAGHLAAKTDHKELKQTQPHHGNFEMSGGWHTSE